MGVARAVRAIVKAADVTVVNFILNGLEVYLCMCDDVIDSVEAEVIVELVVVQKWEKGERELI